MDRLFLSPPHVDDREAEAAADAIRSNWVAPLGPEVNAFETEFASYVGAESAAAVSSGTAGLHLAGILAGAVHGRWILAPTLTFVATLNAFAYAGAEIRLVDSDLETGNLNVERSLEVLNAAAADNDLPAAVVLVDLYGALSDVSELTDRCAELGVMVIEDAAEALGSSRGDRHAGTFGDVGLFSFNGNKIITTSGGGMLVGTAADMDKVRWLASQAREPVRHFQHEVLGYNYRMSNILAAIGRVQLSKLNGFVARRREIRDRYDAALTPLGVSILQDLPGERRNCWLTVGLLDPSLTVSPSEICQELELDNIEARPGWKPMHLQPLYQNLTIAGSANAEDFYLRSLCLPSGSAMTDETQDRVIDAITRQLS